MKYKNANDVLPDSLICELQKYVCGEIIYIPKPTDTHKKWGEVSGSRHYTKERNKTIRTLFLEHRDINALADDFSLSVDSIKKIVYKREPYL